MADICVLCNNEAAGRYVPGVMEFECKTCGWYRITLQAEAELRANSKWKCRVSAYTRHRTIMRKQPITIFTETPQPDVATKNSPYLTVDEILQRFPENVTRQLELSLTNLAGLSKFPGDRVPITVADYPVFYVGDAVRSKQAQSFVVQELMDQELIKGTGHLDSEMWLTAKGWKTVADLQNEPEVETKQVFIAMWFDPSMDTPAENGFKQAIRDAGYEPLKINDLEHNGHIDDEIVAQIRRSKFVVCDFTGHRAGVYFEAGFALGLGLPVIWTCRADHLKDVHFDTRQYNHIVWNDADDLYRQLLNRIRATIV